MHWRLVVVIVCISYFSKRTPRHLG